MSNPLAPEWLDYPADVNAIAESVWPRHAKRRATGELEVAGVPVTEIANQYGTPIYVIDEDDFRARATAAKTALTDAAKKIGTQAKVYYASKAFLSTEIVGWFKH
jgi:diaminopimelate decarboxylase